MVKISVSHVPLMTTQRELKSLKKQLQETLCNMPAGIAKEDVLIFFPSDRLAEGLGEIIVCEVAFVKGPSRTPNVVQDIKGKVERITQSFFPDARIVVV